MRRAEKKTRKFDTSKNANWGKTHNCRAGPLSNTGRKPWIREGTRVKRTYMQAMRGRQAHLNDENESKTEERGKVGQGIARK